MRAVTSPLAAHVCRSCAASVRPTPRKPFHTRLASTFAASRKSSAFSAFFFDNHRWLPTPKNVASASSPTRGHTIDAAQPSAAEVTSVRSFREAEVLTPRRLAKIYWQLSKSSLTVLVSLTAMSGVALCPLPTSVPVLLSTALGTALCSASANTFNQIQEVPYDAQMARTRNRPLVRRAISPLHATGFGVAAGVAGPALLWTMVNPTTALLGAANIALYAGAYTYLKRKSTLNTWIGSVVGGIPPLMGWTACGGSLLPSSMQSFELVLPSFVSSISALPTDAALADNPLAPLALFLLLYSWQFPHFNGLSYLVRESYAQAGYRMLCVLDPHKNATVALRHALLLVPATSLLMPLAGLTTWAFALTSLVPHAICVDAAYKFWKYGGEKQARKVFQHSLWYLPVLLGLMMFHKRGMDWGSWVGLGSEEVAVAEEASESKEDSE